MIILLTSQTWENNTLSNTNLLKHTNTQTHTHKHTHNTYNSIPDKSKYLSNSLYLHYDYMYKSTIDTNENFGYQKYFIFHKKIRIMDKISSYRLSILTYPKKNHHSYMWKYNTKTTHYPMLTSIIFTQLSSFILITNVNQEPFIFKLLCQYLWFYLIPFFNDKYMCVCIYVKN